VRRIWGWLSDNDHQRYVHSYARSMMAMNGHPGLSAIDAEQAIVDDIYLFAELRQKYGVEEDDVINFSLHDGAIYEDTEPA
jgi:hypothetical protein